MCHNSDFDHLPREPLYKRAEPGQIRKQCGTPSEAKFWREAQEKPTSWIIQANNVVVFIGKRSCL